MNIEHFSLSWFRGSDESHEQDGEKLSRSSETASGDPAMAFDLPSVPVFRRLSRQPRCRIWLRRPAPSAGERARLTLSATDAEPLDQSLVTGLVGAPQVVEQ